MAIIKETIGNLTKIYSDSNFLIKKVGTEELYAEAYDVQNFEYEETDIPMEIPEMEEHKLSNMFKFLERNDNI